MTFHLAALSDSVDQAILPLPFLDDAYYTRQNLGGITNGAILTTERVQRIGAIMAGSASIERARFVNSDLNTKVNTPYEVKPLGGAEADSPLAICDLFGNPLTIPKTGSVQALEIENDAAGSAEQVQAGIWYVPSAMSPVQGDIRTIRGTLASVAGSAEAWTPRTATFDDELTGNQYTVVGGRVAVATTANWWRLRFQGQLERPGAPIYDAVGDLDYHRFRRGGLGVWGTFGPQTPPTFETVHTTTEGATFELDVIVS